MLASRRLASAARRSLIRDWAIVRSALHHTAEHDDSSQHPHRYPQQQQQPSARGRRCPTNDVNVSLSLAPDWLKEEPLNRTCVVMYPSEKSDVVTLPPITPPRFDQQHRQQKEEEDATRLHETQESISCAESYTAKVQSKNPGDGDRGLPNPRGGTGDGLGRWLTDYHVAGIAIIVICGIVFFVYTAVKNKDYWLHRPYQLLYPQGPLLPAELSIRERLQYYAQHRVQAAAAVGSNGVSTSMFPVWVLESPLGASSDSAAGTTTRTSPSLRLRDLAPDALAQALNAPGSASWMIAQSTFSYTTSAAVSDIRAEGSQAQRVRVVMQPDTGLVERVEATTIPTAAAATPNGAKAKAASANTNPTNSNTAEASSTHILLPIAAPLVAVRDRTGSYLITDAWLNVTNGRFHCTLKYPPVAPSASATARVVATSGREVACIGVATLERGVDAGMPPALDRRHPSEKPAPANRRASSSAAAEPSTSGPLFLVIRGRAIDMENPQDNIGAFAIRHELQGL